MDVERVVSEELARSLVEVMHGRHLMEEQSRPATLRSFGRSPKVVSAAP